MTQSLLSAWIYLYSCHEESKEAAMEDFIRTLRREKGAPSAAMLDGREFEDEVYRAAANMPRQAHKKWESGIYEVARIIAGAPVQVKVQREIPVAGYNFLLYGVLDALKAGVIYDVKFSTKGFGSADLAGKYLESPQHPAYLYMVPEARKFVYLVSDGKDIYTEEYTRENTPFIGDLIAEFMTSIEGMGLLSLYLEHWEAL